MMYYKIGEFSNMAKTTIKTLRYYERENLLRPAKVDENGYRYYEAKQLIELAKVISLRQIGLSISDIRKVLNGEIDLNFVLLKRKECIEKEVDEYKYQLSKINYLLEGKVMKYEAIIKELPECIIYYKEGVVLDHSKISEFILDSAKECLKANPNMKCTRPDYCYVNYLDGEYRESNFKMRYAQAVEEAGIETENIKFEKLKPVKAICIYHKGDYRGLTEAYSFIMKYIEENNYEIIDFPRECYIDGIWNKKDVEEWLTEIQVPVKKKN